MSDEMLPAALAPVVLILMCMPSSGWGEGLMPSISKEIDVAEE